jgi:2-polyprenyl-6-methoxyphenol hydroxylase-like FAD-dependent oxidoreductase
LAFQRVGIEATVYERAPVLREVGAGMMLWPNATRVLQELGVLDRVLARSGPNEYFLVRNQTGKILMKIALGRFDVPAVCMRRCDLLGALLDELPGHRVQLGSELVRFEQLPNRVQLHFADGTSATHDAIIGADGLRSRVRTQLHGAIHPIYRGYVVWRGVAHYSGDAVPAGFNSETWGRGHRFGILNTGHERFTWYATANVPENFADDLQCRKTQLQRMFANWHRPIPELIDGTDAILRNGAYDLPFLPRWGQGRVTLLGDAAHPCTPNLGQGGCMALEDGLVLAKCVAGEASLELALRRYESLRRARTRHVQNRSWLIGNIGQWQNRVAVAGRGVVTSLLPARLFERNLRRLYAYQT